KDLVRLQVRPFNSRPRETEVGARPTARLQARRWVNRGSGLAVHPVVVLEIPGKPTRIHARLRWAHEHADALAGTIDAIRADLDSRSSRPRNRLAALLFHVPADPQQIHEVPVDVRRKARAAHAALIFGWCGKVITR